jgi:hypothetical protein
LLITPIGHSFRLAIIVDQLAADAYRLASLITSFAGV